ncbi:hypothetical protein GE061_000936 [Apolygus lucorum]|uniref:Uncharacterized protein n=1 Tax=Apolygus lucorum TaxID=248454 RepID=A0A8S9Y5Y5_APOLU|nr:hypothetical protein GE061_000936 [Apolygus lucorum]
MPVFSFWTSFGPVYQRISSPMGPVMLISSDVQDGRTRCSGIDNVTNKFDSSLCDTVLPDFKAINQTVQIKTVVMCFGLYDILYELCKVVPGEFADIVSADYRESQKSSNFCVEAAAISLIQHTDPALNKWADHLKKLLLQQNSCEDLCQFENGIHSICKLIVASHRYLRRTLVIDYHEAKSFPSSEDDVSGLNQDTMGTTPTISTDVDPPNTNTNYHEAKSFPSSEDDVSGLNQDTMGTTPTISTDVDPSNTNTNYHEAKSFPSSEDDVSGLNQDTMGTTATISTDVDPSNTNTNYHEAKSFPLSEDDVSGLNQDTMGTTATISTDVDPSNTNTNYHEAKSFPLSEDDVSGFNQDTMGTTATISTEVDPSNTNTNYHEAKSFPLSEDDVSGLNQDTMGTTPTISTEVDPPNTNTNLTTAQRVEQTEGLVGLKIWLAVITVTVTLTLIIVTAYFIRKKLSSNELGIRQPLFSRRKSYSFADLLEL